MGIFDFFKNKPERAPDFTNVRSGSRSTAEAPSPPAPIEPVRRETVYEVKSGDSLSKIAQKYYGKATLWTEIYEANRDTIKDPDLIYPGQKIRIPDLDEKKRS